MQESREALLVVQDRCYPSAVERAFAAADESAEPLRAGIEAMIAMAEVDPRGARAALWRLQADWKTLERLQDRVGGDPTQAALRIGATIHVARAELASPRPRLRHRLPELLQWLGLP